MIKTIAKRREVARLGFGLCVCAAALMNNQSNAVAKALGQTPTAPPASGTDKALSKVQLQRREFANLRQETGETEKTNPSEAIARYKKFWEDTVDLDPAVSAEVCTWIARLYHSELKDDKNALQVCDFAIARYKTSPSRIQPVVYKMQILVDALRTDEAQAWAEKNWSLGLISGPDWMKQLLAPYTTAMIQQRKRTELVEQITKTFRRLPVYLGDEAWGPGVVLYPALIDQITSPQNKEAALSWAKLRYMLCPYDQISVGRAAETCLQLAGKTPTKTSDNAVSDAEGDQTTPRVFGELPPDAAASPKNVVVPVLLSDKDRAQIESTLRSVPLPKDAIDEQAISTRLLSLTRKNEQQRSEAITLLLLTGSYRKAMDEAARYKTELPESPNGVKQIARVFKTVDLNIARANAYIEYATSKKGVDPLLAFYKEFPAESPSN